MRHHHYFEKRNLHAKPDDHRSSSPKVREMAATKIFVADQRRRAPQRADLISSRFEQRGFILKIVNKDLRTGHAIQTQWNVNGSDSRLSGMKPGLT